MVLGTMLEMANFHLIRLRYKLVYWLRSRFMCVFKKLSTNFPKVVQKHFSVCVHPIIGDFYSNFSFICERVNYF